MTTPPNNIDARLRQVELAIVGLRSDIDNMTARWAERIATEARQKSTLPSWFGVAISALMFLAMLVGFYIQFLLARMGP